MLAGDEDTLVRMTVAGRADTPPETLERLASDADTIVVRAVARNPHAPDSARAFASFVTSP